MGVYYSIGPRQRAAVVIVPGLRKRIGAGDIVASVAGVLNKQARIQCERRRELLNRILQFLGRK